MFFFCTNNSNCFKNEFPKYCYYCYIVFKSYYAAAPIEFYMHYFRSQQVPWAFITKRVSGSIPFRRNITNINVYIYGYIIFVKISKANSMLLFLKELAARCVRHHLFFPVDINGIKWRVSRCYVCTRTRNDGGWLTVYYCDSSFSAGSPRSPRLLRLRCPRSLSPSPGPWRAARVPAR